MPPSAISSVCTELQRYRLPLNILDARKGAQDHIKLRKFHISLIRHDHLRNNTLGAHLRKIISEAIFVVDEFHLALNKTKRTSACLELARCSRLFIVMSGTPIKDTHTDLLIPWLEPVVSFEVTEKNLWTAVAGMLSRRLALPTKIVELEEEVALPFEIEQKNVKNYSVLIPP